MEFELARSRANSGELFNDTNTGNGRKKTMNYEEWSKSREVARSRANFSIEFCDGLIPAEQKRRFFNSRTRS